MSGAAGAAAAPDDARLVWHRQDFRTALGSSARPEFVLPSSIDPDGDAAPVGASAAAGAHSTAARTVIRDSVEPADRTWETNEALKAFYRTVKPHIDRVVLPSWTKAVEAHSDFSYASWAFEQIQKYPHEAFLPPQLRDNLPAKVFKTDAAWAMLATSAVQFRISKAAAAVVEAEGKQTEAAKASSDLLNSLPTFVTDKYQKLPTSLQNQIGTTDAQRIWSMLKAKIESSCTAMQVRTWERVALRLEERKRATLAVASPLSSDRAGPGSSSASAASASASASQAHWTADATHLPDLRKLELDAAKAKSKPAPTSGAGATKPSGKKQTTTHPHTSSKDKPSAARGQQHGSSGAGGSGHTGGRGGGRGSGGPGGRGRGGRGRKGRG